jgi:enoyl-CoA hydratase/carnithine racemase
MASRSPRALAHIKLLARIATEKPLTEGLRLERNLFMDLMTTEEALTLMKAYLKTLDH